MNRDSLLLILAILMSLHPIQAAHILQDQERTDEIASGNLASHNSNVILSEPTNCSAGKDLLGICALQAQNFTGENITIAIIDYQFYIDRLSERELSRDRIANFEEDFSEHERHGTACAEIIGEIAPNATLIMVESESSEEGFRDAVDELIRLNRVAADLLLGQGFLEAGRPEGHLLFRGDHDEGLPVGVLDRRAPGQQAGKQYDSRYASFHGHLFGWFHLNMMRAERFSQLGFTSTRANSFA